MNPKNKALKPKNNRADSRIASKNMARDTEFTKIRRRYEIALSLLLSLGSLLILGFTAQQVWAAEFIEPPGGPSEGNIPVTIWNRDPTIAATDIWDEKQVDASINIDGQIKFGGENLDLGVGGTDDAALYGLVHYYDGSAAEYALGPEDDLFRIDTYWSNYPNPGDTRVYEEFSVGRSGNVYASGGGSFTSYLSTGASSQRMYENGARSYIYQALARYDETNPSDNYQVDPDLDMLFLGRTYDYTGSPDVGWIDRFSVTASGDVWAKENIKADGCFGPSFVGNTVATYRPVDVSGYYGVNNICNGEFAGSHVCTAQEMLESIKCSDADSPIRAVADDKQAWINAGPPGFTANANDCLGWTAVTPSEQQTSYGRFWIFNVASGGRGTSASCNATAKSFACCY
jgi:hypothetical protein